MARAKLCQQVGPTPGQIPVKLPGVGRRQSVIDLLQGAPFGG